MFSAILWLDRRVNHGTTEETNFKQMVSRLIVIDFQTNFPSILSTQTIPEQSFSLLV
jgi:hypothetical protein